MKPPVELLVCDLVGTSVAVGDAVPAAFRTAFTTEGIELTDAQIADVRGASKKEGIARLLRLEEPTDAPTTPDVEKRTERVYRVFEAALLEGYSRAEITALPGAEVLFSVARRGRIYIALTSGLGRDAATLLVDRLGWHDQVDTVITADDVARGRPAPDLIYEAMRRGGIDHSERIATVGDTVADLQAALNASVGYSFGVTTGAHPRERLEPHRHTLILDDLHALAAWLDEVRASARLA